MAMADNVAYLRAVKLAASAGVLPGKGREFVEYYITLYENGEIALNVAVCNIKQYLPTMESIGSSNSINITSEVLCANPIESTSIDCSVIQRTTDAYNSCIAGFSGTYQFDGSTAGDRFGGPSVTGDLNDDGIEDLVVAAERPSSAPKVYVFFGGTNFESEDSSSADLVFTGVSSSTLFGSTVTVGDLNNDGKKDLIVADKEVSSNTGTVYAFYGSSSITSQDLSSGGSADLIFNGESTGDKFGSDISVKDLNGDGKEDLLVGAPEAQSNQGKAYVFYGSSSIASVDADNADATFTGEGSDNYFGISVSGGDLNNDGYVDLIVGADSVGLYGKAYVFYGGASFVNQPASNATGAVGATFTGTKVAGRFGLPVDSADLSGDGIDDLVVAAHAVENGFVYVFYGGTSFSSQDLSSGGSADVTLSGPSANSFFGYFLEVGDVNGDSIADLSVNSLVAEKVYVFFGGSSITSEGADNADVIFTGKYSSGGFGALLSVGDVNGDGVSDLMLAETLADPDGRADAGSVYVVLGNVGISSIDFSV